MSDRHRQWRSLEQLAADPTARGFLEREFPEGASEGPAELSRRNVLMLLGASLSMAGLTACRRPEETIVPFVEMPEGVIPGIPKKYATTAPGGLGATGLVVTSHEGRPTKIEGNEKHPASLGATDSRLQASILDLYDPDRSAWVLEGGQHASWEAFESAWAGLEPELLASGGEGLAVLSSAYSSPTLARLAASFASRFPNARWVSWDPAGDENALRGLERITGSAWRTKFDLERARVIVSLDSDFLMTEGDSVRNAKGFAAGRRVLSEHDGMNRLYVAEAAYSLTGANADHRLRIRAGRIGALAAALASRVAGGDPVSELASGSAAPDGVDDAWVTAVAEDLLANRGQGLVVAGRRQPPEVHALAYAINLFLGNVGSTVTFHGTTDAGLPDTHALSDLVTAMHDGKVGTLVVLDGNPVYDAPSDLQLAAALEQVPTVIRLSQRVDETSRASTWHLPQAHFLESWGDARSFDGLASIIQPLVEPLFGGRSAIEIVGRLAGGAEVSGYEAVRETWRGVLPAESFESDWTRVLHDGLLAGSALPPASPGIVLGVGRELIAALTRPQAETGLDLIFAASPALGDGRQANNPWLQELPDAVTKLTWDNAALLSPATAAAHNLSNEDGVRLTLGERSVDFPVWIVPGQADDTVVAYLGYGRTAAGRIGNGVGVDIYPLRTLAGRDLARGAALAANGARYELAQTQDHGTLEEPDFETPFGDLKGKRRPLIHESTLDGYREDPEFAKHHSELPEASLWEEPKYEERPQWGMSIDLNSCTGCNACIIACQSENNIPVVGRDQVRRGREMHWLRVDRYFDGDQADPAILFQAVPCQMCENAPCEQVCPVAATVHDKQGLNVMIYNRCIGTRYCANNCPYKVRRFNYYNYTKDMPSIERLAQNPDVTVRSRGVMEKCTYCVQRIRASGIEAKLDGRDLADGDVRTACQQACPADAISFGDIHDRDSEVAAMKRQDRNYTLLDEIYTRPRTSYLAKLRNPNPRLVEG